MITIIDYGIGNLASVEKAFKYINVEVILKENIVAKIRYGLTEFALVVRRDNIWGMQCHPEKK